MLERRRHRRQIERLRRSWQTSQQVGGEELPAEEPETTHDILGTRQQELLSDLQQHLADMRNNQNKTFLSSSSVESIGSRECLGYAPYALIPSATL